MTNRVEDIIQDHHVNFLSLDPGTQGPPPPSSRAPQPTLEGHALPLQLWGLEQGGAWGAHTVWRSCWFPALCLPMRGNRPLKEGQAASMAPQGRMVGAQSSRVPSPNPCCQLQLLPNSSFPEAAKLEVSSEPRPPVLYEGSAKRHGIRGAG